MQARILELNSKAFYLLCACHNLNLVICDWAQSSPERISFLQKLYVFFSASTRRWSIFKQFNKHTLKSLSETRWECRISSIKVLRFETKSILDALVAVKDSTKDRMVYNDANALAKEIFLFDFLVALVVWYDVLSQINKL